MRVSSATRLDLTLPSRLGWLVVLAGAGAFFATYWDEAWHTDVGRDRTWSAPHVALYGSVAAAGFAVALWILMAAIPARSLRPVLRDRPLMLTAAAGVAVLGSAPIDAFWHDRFGRDSVLWSPPHMMVVLGSTAMVLGVLSGLSTTAAAVRAGAGVLLLANAVAMVFEYEADVPQFTEALYLPILLAAGLLAVGVVRSAVPLRAPVLAVVLGYASLRVAIALGLAGLGRSTPDLPIAVLGLAAMDLPLSSTRGRVAAAAVATAALAWFASALGMASVSTGSVAVTAGPVLVGGALILLQAFRPARAATLTAFVVGGALLTVAMPARPAYAHDPGQGELVAHVDMTGVSDAHGSISLRISATDRCEDLTPVRVVARRAGQTRNGPLRATGPCTFAGTVDVAPKGRWFAYAEFRHREVVVEGWLPIDADQTQSLTQRRALYIPAGSGASNKTSEILLGALIYSGGIGLLGAGIFVTRRARIPRVAAP